MSATARESAKLIDALDYSMPAPLEPGARKRVIQAIQGSWVLPCMSSESLQISASMRIRFEGDQSIGAMEWFKGLDCKIPYVTTEITSRYKVGWPSGAVPGAYQIDFETLKVTQANFDDARIESYNRYGECGRRGWVRGIFQDVSGTGCDDDVFISRQRHTIFKVQGDRLWITGQSTDDGREPETRPTQLLEVPFIRQ